MDDDDADSGAGERGLVLAGCDGALFSVARAGPTTRQGLHRIDETSLFSVNKVLRFVRYSGGRAATIRQRAIERHRGVAVDGDVHIDGKHVVALILNYGPDRAGVELLANSARAVRLGLETVATQTPEVIMAPARPAPAAASKHGGAEPEEAAAVYHLQGHVHVGSLLPDVRDTALRRRSADAASRDKP